MHIHYTGINQLPLYVYMQYLDSFKIRSLERNKVLVTWFKLVIRKVLRLQEGT